MDTLNQNVKHKDKTKLFTDCSARPQGSQTIMWFPGSKKHTEVDIHIDTNVSILVSKVVKLSIGCCTALCIVNILFVTAAMRYQNSELSVMEQNVMILNHKVELMAVTSDSLRQNIVMLQDRMNTLMNTHFSMAGGVSANYQGSEHSQEMEVAPSTDLKFLIGSNFSLLELDGNILNTDGALKDSLELENVDLMNRTLSSSAEGADSQFSYANDTSVDTFGSIFTNDIETSGRLQELKLENVTDISQRHVMDILFQADDSSGYEYAETEGMSMGRTKRSNRRGPLLVHFNGGVPDLLVEDGGRMIAPWYADEQGAGDFLLSKFQLREGNGAVEVLEKGLYYIYAQVYYTTTESSNSFSIKLREKGKSSHEELAVCSVNIAVKQYMSEVSCFTSVVRFLNATDRVFLWQRERNRRIVLRNGFSFFGFVHLSGKRD